MILVWAGNSAGNSDVLWDIQGQKHAAHMLHRAAQDPHNSGTTRVHSFLESAQMLTALSRSPERIVPTFPQTDMMFSSDHPEHEISILTKDMSSAITQDCKSDFPIKIAMFGVLESCELRFL